MNTQTHSEYWREVDSVLQQRVGFSLDSFCCHDNIVERCFEKNHDPVECARRVLEHDPELGESLLEAGYFEAEE